MPAILYNRMAMMIVWIKWKNDNKRFTIRFLRFLPGISISFITFRMMPLSIWYRSNENPDSRALSQTMLIRRGNPCEYLYISFIAESLNILMFLEPERLSRNKM